MLFDMFECGSGDGGSVGRCGICSTWRCCRSLLFGGQELNHVAHRWFCLQDVGNFRGKARFPNIQENAEVGWCSPGAGAQQLTGVFPRTGKNEVQTGFV